MSYCGKSLFRLSIATAPRGNGALAGQSEIKRTPFECVRGTNYQQVGLQTDTPPKSQATRMGTVWGFQNSKNVRSHDETAQSHRAKNTQ